MMKRIFCSIMLMVVFLLGIVVAKDRVGTKLFDMPPGFDPAMSTFTGMYKDMANQKDVLVLWGILPDPNHITDPINSTYPIPVYTNDGSGWVKKIDNLKTLLISTDWLEYIDHDLNEQISPPFILNYTSQSIVTYNNQIWIKKRNTFHVIRSISNGSIDQITYRYDVYGPMFNAQEVVLNNQLLLINDRNSDGIYFTKKVFVVNDNNTPPTWLEMPQPQPIDDGIWKYFTTSTPSTGMAWVYGYKCFYAGRECSSNADGWGGMGYNTDLWYSKEGNFWRSVPKPATSISWTDFAVASYNYNGRGDNTYFFGDNAVYKLDLVANQFKFENYAEFYSGYDGWHYTNQNYHWNGRNLIAPVKAGAAFTEIVPVYAISGNIINVPANTWVALSGDKQSMTTTDANGYFEFNNIPAGTYAIQPDPGIGPYAEGEFKTVTVINKDVSVVFTRIGGYSTIYYVDQTNGSDNNDGKSWPKAFQTMETGLNFANRSAQINANVKVYVAKGTYTPAIGMYGDFNGDGNQQQYTFSYFISNGVSIYGGFPTGGPDDKRDWISNKTTLMGITGNQNCIAATYGGNTIDGFEICFGSSIGYCGPGGGGLRVWHNTIAIKNCFFHDDKGCPLGGAVYFGPGAGSCSFTNCQFNDNFANRGGGAVSTVENATNDMTFTNCQFIRNSCGTEGGAIAFFSSGSLVLDKCVFDNTNSDNSNNAAYGGALYVSSASKSATIKNKSSFKNFKATEGGACWVSSNALTIDDVDFIGNTGFHNGGALFVDVSSLNITNSRFFSNQITSNQGGAIFCICEENGTIIGNATISGSSFISNTSNVNGGAIFLNGGDLSLINNCAFTSNTSTFGDGGAIYSQNAGKINISGASFNNNQVLNSLGNDGGALFIGNAGHVYIDANSSFTNNSSTSSGGAVCMLGNGILTCRKSSFSFNTSSLGGAIFTGGLDAMELDGVYLISNQAMKTTSEEPTDGGGINCGAWEISIVNSVFENNSISNLNSPGDGGAVYVSGGDKINCVNSIFYNNSAITGVRGSRGGALYLGGINFFSHNLLFANNSSNLGGAVFFSKYGFSPVGTFYNATFYQNSATTSGGALYLDYGPSASAQPIFMNCIFSENSAPEFLVMYSPIGFPAPVRSYCYSQDAVPPPSQPPGFLNPFSLKGTNGWFSTNDGLNLSQNSICADAGDPQTDPSGYPMVSGQYVDITGVQPRFVGVTGPLIDQGAYERSSLFTISGRVINVPEFVGEVDIRLMGLSNATEQTVHTVNGVYTFPNIIPGNYRVLPQDRNGLIRFTPDHQEVLVYDANVIVPDFTLIVNNRFVISGKINGVSSGKSLVTLTGDNLTAPITFPTDDNGNFAFLPQLPGTYVVSPQADYWYCPANQQSVTLINHDVSVNFNAYSKSCYDAADFTYSPPGAIKVDQEVDFKFVSTCINPYSFSWDFGDNTKIETLPFPSHVFADAGTYTVSLKITMCPNLTKTMVKSITVECPIPMTPTVAMSTVPGDLVTKVTPGAPDEWTIVDQCDASGNLGKETVKFSAKALPYSCGGLTYPITNWQWWRDDSPEPATPNKPPNEHTFIDLLDGQIVKITVTDVNNNSFTDKKKIKLVPCTPDFVDDPSHNPILISKDNGGGRSELINGDDLLYENKMENLKLSVGLAPFPMTCRCKITGISYHWDWTLIGVGKQDEGDNNLGSLQTDGTWQTAWQPVTTISLGKYVIKVPVTMTLEDGSTKQTTFTRVLSINYEIPEVACPTNGCRSAPQLNKPFYDEIMWERISPEAELASGNYEETVPAMGGGFANKQGYGSLDEGVFKSVTVPESFAFIAHIKNPEDLTNPNVQAGLMVRENAASFGRMIFFGINNGFLTIMSRTKAHEDVAMFPLQFTDETWLQIDRYGSLIYCFASRDGLTWDGPFTLGDDIAFSGWDGVIEVGLAAAGDNTFNTGSALINLTQAQFDNISMMPWGNLKKPGVIINTVFANGNLISNWSFENDDDFITSGNDQDTWYNNHFEPISHSDGPAYEGRYYLRTFSKPAGQTLSTPLFPMYFEKNGITAAELIVSFWVRSNHPATITPGLLLQPADGSAAVVSPLPSITITPDQINTWVQYSIPQNSKTTLPIPDGTLYSGFALQLFDKASSYEWMTIDFDNVLVAPRFETPISQPVTMMTFANGANQKFQTIQLAGEKDIVASLLLDEDGRTSRALPVFAKERFTESGLLNPDFHDVKLDPLEDMRAYFQYYQENRSWTIDRLAADHGKIIYEDGPLDRVLAVKGRMPQSEIGWKSPMDVETHYEAFDGGVGDGIMHQSIKTVNTSFNSYHGYQSSIDYSNAYGHVVVSIKQNNNNSRSHPSLVSTRDPDIFDRTWKTVSPQGQGCDQSDINCIAPTTFRYSTTDQVLETQDPDAGLRQTFYDKLGNARLFQDGNTRNSNQILVNMYDAFSRPITTYLVNDPGGTRWANGQANANDPAWPENQTDYKQWTTKVLRTVYDSVPDVTLLPPGFDISRMKNLKGRVSARYSFPSPGVVVGTFFSYDNRGNASSVWRWVPGAPIQQEHADFNMAGQVTQRRTLGAIPGAGGQSFTKKEDYYYDELNLLDKVFEPSTNKMLAKFSYLPEGKVSLKYIGEGNLRLRYRYDLADRIDDVQSQSYNFNSGNWEKSDVWEQMLEYNEQGNISQQAYQLYKKPDVTNPYRLVQYSYDGFNRLLNANYGSSTTGFGNIDQWDIEFDEMAAYNNDGAITALGRAGNAQNEGGGGTYTYYPNSHRLRSVTGYIQSAGKDRSDPNNYVYDDNGNMIIDKTLKQKIDYDYRNMPVKITQYSDNFITEQRIIEFMYDADGKRVKKMTTKNAP